MSRFVYAVLSSHPLIRVRLPDVRQEHCYLSETHASPFSSALRQPQSRCLLVISQGVKIWNNYPLKRKEAEKTKISLILEKV